jgi:hypothetical protein
MKRVFLVGSLFVVATVLTTLGTAPAQSHKTSDIPGTKSTAQKKSGQTVPQGASVIGHLESKDRIITVSKGPKGPLYTITTKDGKILATKIDEKSLQAKYPDLYHQVKTGIAGNDARL